MAEGPWCPLFVFLFSPSCESQGPSCPLPCSRPKSITPVDLVEPLFRKPWRPHDSHWSHPFSDSSHVQSLPEDACCRPNLCLLKNHLSFYEGSCRTVRSGPWPETLTVLLFSAAGGDLKFFIVTTSWVPVRVKKTPISQSRGEYQRSSPSPPDFNVAFQPATAVD